MIIKKYVFLCNEEFCVDKTKKKKSTKQDVKLDHCHFTGKYRGAAHSNCNLKYKVPKIYQWHFIIFGQKLQHFSNDAFQSYYDLFQVN